LVEKENEIVKHLTIENSQLKTRVDQLKGKIDIWRYSMESMKNQIQNKNKQNSTKVINT